MSEVETEREKIAEQMEREKERSKRLDAEEET